MDFVLNASQEEESYGDTLDSSSIKSTPNFSFGKWEISFLKVLRKVIQKKTH